MLYHTTCMVGCVSTGGQGQGRGVWVIAANQGGGLAGSTHWQMVLAEGPTYIFFGFLFGLLLSHFAIHLGSRFRTPIGFFVVADRPNTSLQTHSPTSIGHTQVKMASILSQVCCAIRTVLPLPNFSCATRAAPARSSCWRRGSCRSALIRSARVISLPSSCFSYTNMMIM